MLKTTKEGIKGNFFNNKLKKINYELEMIG